MNAAQNGHIGVVEELLRRGADAKCTDSFNTTALWRAARYGHTEIVKVLLDVEGSDSVLNLPKRARTWKMRAVMLAVGLVNYCFKSESLEVLCQSEGMTPLATAAFRGREEVVRLLMCAGADHTKRNSQGFTPLQLAQQEHHDRVVRCLEASAVDKPQTGTASGVNDESSDGSSGSDVQGDGKTSNSSQMFSGSEHRPQFQAWSAIEGEDSSVGHESKQEDKTANSPQPLLPVQERAGSLCAAELYDLESPR